MITLTSELKNIAQRLRIHSIKMTAEAGSGHPTTCMSMAEIVATLFFSEMKFNVNDPHDAANDEIVLSKGHAAPILWAAYAEAGIIDEKQLLTLRKITSNLEGHPTPRMPWIKAATGSLGQGLSIGLGIALAQKKRQSPARTYVVLGDGEMAEGSVWEAAALASHHTCDNIVAILDANGQGQTGHALHHHEAEKYANKFIAFGWKSIVVDGHNVEELTHAFAQAHTHKGPVAIVAKTFKGYGVSFTQDKPNWHGKPMKGEDLTKALAELGNIANTDAKKLVKKPAIQIALHSHGKISMTPPSYKTGDQTSPRQAYGVALKKLGDSSKDIIALDADTSNSTFAEELKKTHPAQFVECFIAEQNMVGMGVGFGIKKFIPFCSTFAAFHTRGHDFIRMAAYSESNVKIVGSHVGVSIGADGASQMGLEDLAMMRPIPHCAVLYPSDGVSTELLTQELANYPSMGYLRTTREKLPILYENTEKFPIGGSKVLRQHANDKCVIIAAGITVHEALKATQTLEKQNIQVCIIDAYSVKPIDVATILSHAKRCRNVLVVEDHYAEGGLGDAVTAALAGTPMQYYHLCVKEIPRSGEPHELLALYKIDAAAIVQIIQAMR